MKGTGSLNNRGFTLLETMIALAVVAVSLVALLTLGNRSIGVQARLQKVTQATLLAQHKMAEIETRAERDQLDFTPRDGQFEEPFEAYRWRSDYQNTPIASVKMVTVAVLWGNEAQHDAVEITSFLFQ